MEHVVISFLLGSTCAVPVSLEGKIFSPDGYGLGRCIYSHLESKIVYWLLLNISSSDLMVQVTSAEVSGLGTGVYSSSYYIATRCTFGSINNNGTFCSAF